MIGGQRYAFIRSDAAAMGPRFKFARHGQCGAEISEALPHLAKVVDDICIIKSVHTSQFNHAPAQIFFNTGFAQPGRPSIGSWVTYGLGAETSDLPAFVVMSTGRGISGGAANWSSGFLPSVYTGVRLRNQGDPILNVSSPDGIDQSIQKDTLQLVGDLNTKRLRDVNDPEIETRIASYEMAFRLQSSAPELMDITSESKATLDLYGVDPKKPNFARACLLARRMVERGRALHQHLPRRLGRPQRRCRQSSNDEQRDRPGLLRSRRRPQSSRPVRRYARRLGRRIRTDTHDRKQPALGRSLGRDHHPQAFTMWMAGGGVKAGLTYGQTDELGFNIVKDPVHVHDIQATILHLLGLDHERLTYRYAGRDFRLTDVHGTRIEGILA